ncbi:MAG: right-handed parallel beta-helix repeat-containing protein [Thermodesulfobacteriota bacterium]|nr:right-handed parallel beta-helix repeat-containing protein [Thermodesulfobacteriota bacterium]
MKKRRGSGIFLSMVVMMALSRAAAYGGVHDAGGCRVCHYDECTDCANRTFVRCEINTPNSGAKAVVLTASTGAHSGADGDETHDGACEVCHTATLYHTNDGDNANHFDGQNCIACHPHSRPNMFGAILITGLESHQTHMGDAKGPVVTACTDCHAPSTYTLFADGEPLASTTACDTCHSPGGTYDGSQMAKVNWVSRVYEADGTRLQPGMDQWCATCHDEAPAVMLGVSAPQVMGDESAVTPYGTGYGFNKTGHGLPAMETYPATGSAGAGLGCLDCHDAAMAHVDGDARTYVPDSTYTAVDPVSANYQNGYRLKDVTTGYDNKYPMHVPRTGSAGMYVREDWEFALCFQCHDDSSLYDGGDPATGGCAGTNFRSVATSLGTGDEWRSMHDYHTSGVPGPMGPSTPQYDSDYDGTADSKMTCPACHNVHGSPSPAMMRHGELISTPGTSDKVPSLDLMYLPQGTYPMLAESTGGTTPWWGSMSGDVGENGVCNMCHNNHTEYVRRPTNAPGPEICNLDPAGRAVGAPINSNVTFTLSDEGAGVDWTTFSIELSGDLGYYQVYTDEDTAVVSKTGTPFTYDVTVDPDVDFAELETITVTVCVDDLAVPANPVQSHDWWFKTSATWYVDGDVPASGDGRSWAGAVKTLEEAVALAGYGHEIWVKEGVYTHADYIEPEQTAFLYGGFAGGETVRDERDWETNVTTIDAQGLVFSFYFSEWTTDPYLFDGFAIDGFTLTGAETAISIDGNLDNPASFTVSNCTFTGNTGDRQGGAIHNRSDHPLTVTHCTFFQNSAEDGGALYSRAGYSSLLTVTDCTFTENSSQHSGGAIFMFNAVATISDCLFTGNSAPDNQAGGAIYCWSSSGTIANCAFTENSAGYAGGAIDNREDPSPTITSCTFRGNDGEYGGAIRNHNVSGTIANCSFAENSAAWAGGAIYNAISPGGPSPTITHCTVWGNSTTRSQGAIYNSINATPVITNCTVWGNTGGQIYDSDASPVVTYCNIEGGYTGEGNIDADPLLADPGSGDFHLLSGSPCIDGGTNGAAGLPATDFEGDARIIDGDGDSTETADMGVDEYVPQP